MEIKRISKYSNMGLITFASGFTEFIPDNIRIIQIVNDDKCIAYEYVNIQDIDKYIKEQSSTAVAPVKSEAQKELETALDTMLNNDPRQKYTGCNLRVPFDRGDWEWINWCLDNMHNEFIRKRIELIKNSGYGA